MTHRAGLDLWEMRYILASARIRTSVRPAHFLKVAIAYLPKGSKFETVMSQKISVMSTSFSVGLRELLHCLYRQRGSDILKALFTRILS